MCIVYVQYCCQITGKKAGGCTEKHDQHHVEIAQYGFPLKQGFQTDVWMWGMKLLPQKNSDKKWSYYDIDADP